MQIKRNIETTSQLDSQLDAIRRINAPHSVDVVDSVMRQICQMPTLVEKTDTPRRRLVPFAGAAAAACLAAVIATLLMIPSDSSNLQAANTPHNDVNLRFFDIYDYCNNYADPDMDESAAYYDNPVTDLF